VGIHKTTIKDNIHGLFFLAIIFHSQNHISIYPLLIYVLTEIETLDADYCLKSLILALF